MSCGHQATVDHFLGKMEVAKTPSYRGSIVGVIAMAIIYNPNQLLATLQEKGLTGASPTSDF
jgi:hypothetical protein